MLVLISIACLIVLVWHSLDEGVCCLRGIPVKVRRQQLDLHGVEARQEYKRFL